MLVLTRKEGEAISIGDDIKIIVMKVRGKQVRLGIKAGPETVVHREEVYQRIHDENVQAAQAAKESVDSANDIFEGEAQSPRMTIKRLKK